METFSAKKMILEKDILLEAGTNELEVLVFFLMGGKFGINVAKVREVILPRTVHRLPQTHASVEGTFRLREKVVPLINLRSFLGMEAYAAEQMADPESSRIIVMEFNQVTNSFRVDAVERIYRVSWEQIHPMPALPGSKDTPVTAIAKLEGQLVPMLDFETIIDRIRTINQLRTGSVPNRLGVHRESKHIVIAEDSATVRQLIVDSLIASGYAHTESFTNGADAWKRIQKAGNSDAQRIDLVISDIEMPQIDGLHLTKLVREHATLSHLPVVLFSSLITPDNLKKGQAVGATLQISKPELSRAVELVDQIFAKADSPSTSVELAAV